MVRHTEITDICKGRLYPDVSRLDWLSALLITYEEMRHEDEDPSATNDMLCEVRGLLIDLRAAVAASEDKQLHALSCELMESEGLDEVTAVCEARALLEALRQYGEWWDKRAASAERAQRLQALWYGQTQAQ